MIISSKEELAEWRTSNASSPLIFTAGVFDLLHAGHIHLIHEARKQTPPDYKFIIALHSDKYVQIKKGKDRPIFPQDHRALILDNVKGVDDVIIWDGWENIIELVELLKPEVLVTTKDKISKTNWENSWKNVAERLNAELIGIDKISPEVSSTKFIDKIANIASE